MTSSLLRHGRRRRLTTVALAAILTLTGCASTSDSDEPAAPSSSPPPGAVPPAEGTTTYPLTLKTWAGESVLQKRPERIAVIGVSPNLDSLQSLAVTPVFTLTEDAEYAWRDKAWFSKIETVDKSTRRDPINFEGIAAAKPDLIVAVGAVWEKPDFTKLAAIAPVLDTEKEGEIGWQDLQRLVGRTLDLSAAADKAVTTAETAIADTAKAHPEFAGKTITIANDYGPQYGLSYYTVAGGVAEGIMGNLGFTANPNAQKFVDEDVVSDENQGLLDADALVVVYSGDDVRKAREAKPLFKGLKPVSEGRYVALTNLESDPNQVVDAAGKQMPNATWVLRAGASAASLPWGVKVVADEWLAGAKLS
ncbi:ABC transporter substrate-binding protein [Micromonospora craniellae]|uniref:Iron-siderophore ABC transporter substrate-binding protein n=1 Tax=Micromonospora craniellae TaxID=2294034 RepID=A0A372FRZ2_9ACTN|nr:ABC transporter substrate-binding protein [Micromonospora craniellae]QOC94758.1 ABC transporter substrate-binding protein [Micromonospora craniellae]RFS43552.1 iron-siderophore ABC transporter substrate-binding protein [Micromonospora craniellae]